MRLSHGYVGCEEEKVSCETFKSPSMMWKRSIVQARAARARPAAPAPPRRARWPCCCWRWYVAAGRVGLRALRGPGDRDPGLGRGGGGGGAGQYRLDYRPPHGSPAPNFTVPARASTINFQGLPGTKYHFMLYYSNATFADLLTWNQTIITAPEPPTNLTVALARNKQATIAWAPPAHGDYTGFRFKVIPLTERAEGGARNITVEASEGAAAGRGGRGGAPAGRTRSRSCPRRHLPAARLHAAARQGECRLRLQELHHQAQHAGQVHRVVPQRDHAAGAVAAALPARRLHSLQGIDSAAGCARVGAVRGEGGRAAGAGAGRLQGAGAGPRLQHLRADRVRARDLRAHTAQYRTVPLRPRDVAVPPADRSATAFRVVWQPPKEESEFEKYQVSVSGGGGAGAGRRRGAAAGARGARAQRHAQRAVRGAGAGRALHRHRQDHVRQGHLLARARGGHAQTAPCTGLAVEVSGRGGGRRHLRMVAAR
ncbi:uncharacterized protein [Choristoneura fumiferana]|uniref:uncharacterized protein n=1 Tax=Choristoneura fumiferana TaxID=7141 RepID=UPI003D159A96